MQDKSKVKANYSERFFIVVDASRLYKIVNLFT